MISPAITAKVNRLLAMVASAGALGGGILVLVLIGMPLGQVVLDYWTPKLQAAMQAPAPAKIEPKKGKL
jgi:hypothetical protein